MKPAASIAALYVIFAVVATIVNLATQAVIVWLYIGPYAIELSILAGTAAGLPVKYVLEKRYVFEFEAKDIAHDSRLFLIYSFMGVFTTLIFWGVEYLFHWVFQTDFMRYVGGALGLGVGYVIKYRLDKRFVFVKAESKKPGPRRTAEQVASGFGPSQS